MGVPLGRWLVAIVGLCTIAAGAGFLLKSWRGDVTQFMELDPAEKRWAVPLGRMGFAARGIVFLLIGGFVLLAAFHQDPNDVKGLGGALESLRAQPYGWVLLGATAAGVCAFGLFGFVQAIYRRVHPHEVSDAKRALTGERGG